MAGEVSKSSKPKKGKEMQVSDDELLDNCIKAKEQCSASTCNKSIKLIKLQCQLCSENFCTTHALPEVHGCGNAAKKAASAPIKKTPNPDKTHQLENKLSKKLEKMKNERKKKGK